MQINKISNIDLNSLKNLNNSMAKRTNIAFSGDKFNTKKAEEEYLSFPHSFVTDIRAMVAVNDAKRIQKKGREAYKAAEDVMVKSGIKYSEATEQLKAAHKTLYAIKESGKGIIYHNNGAIRAVLNRGIMTEFDNDKNLLRESVVENNEVIEVDYASNGINQRVTKIQNGLKLKENPRYIKDDIQTADRVFNFSDDGDLLTYKEGFISKTGKNPLQKIGTQYNYDRNLLREVLLNSNKKDNNSSSELRISYSSDGNIIKAEKDVVFRNKRRTHLSERYTYSSRPEDNSTIKSYDKFSNKAEHLKGRYHIEYGKNNKVLYSSKY